MNIYSPFYNFLYLKGRFSSFLKKALENGFYEPFLPKVSLKHHSHI